MRNHHTTHTRDAALRQLHRVNRWMIAGSVVLTGVLADVAANAFPGKTVKHAKSAKAQSKHSGSSSKTSTGVLKPPAEAPKASESEAARSSESPPAEESTPSKESAPAQESAPAEESAPAPESAPSQESAPAQEAAAEPEASAPAVSGGS